MDIPDEPVPEGATALPSRWKGAISGDPEALRELAGSYWYAVFAWWRCSGVPDAASATEASFTHWLTDGAPQPEDEGAARMRKWLQARLPELAARGLEAVAEPAIAIAADWAEERYAQEPEGTPEHIFARRWALTILEFAAEALRAEYAARGEEALFAEVSPYANFLGGEENRYHTTAQRLGFTTGAARKAVFDFRTRHREILRELIADTVADPAEIDSELTDLLCACDLPGSPADSGPLPTAIRQFKPDELLARAMRTVHMTSGGAGGLWVPPSDAEVAGLFPQYEMLGIIGRGGMGAVYKARQIELDRLVAIKLLPLEVSVDQAFADRFRREARALAKLSHPNIVAVHDFGTTSEGHLYFVMEFIEGADLFDLIHGRARTPAGELTPRRSLEIVMRVCDALDYAHGKGVIHRDVKPANVMVGSEGEVKVADFGLARMNNNATGGGQTRATMVGAIVGTPDYMAPEQKRGGAVDHRADIYSLGAMLYEMLCKEPPQGAFDMPSKRGVDPRVDPIIIRALATQPERRYQTATEMKEALAQVNDALSRPVVPVTAASYLPRQAPFMPKVIEPAPGAAPAPTPVPARPPTQARQISRVRKRRNLKPLLYLGIVVLVVAAAFVFRHQFIDLIATWASAGRERLAGTMTNLSKPPSSEKWVSVLTGAGRIKSGNFLKTQQGLIPGPNELLLIDTGGPIRDGAIRVRLLRASAEGVRLFARMGAGDYSAVLGADQVTLRGGLQGAGYADLRSFFLPSAAAKAEEIEVELRVVGATISVSVNGEELGSIKDRSVRSGSLAVGSFKVEKVIITALDYLVLDTADTK